MNAERSDVELPDCEKWVEAKVKFTIAIISVECRFYSELWLPLLINETCSAKRTVEATRDSLALFTALPVILLAFN